MHAILNEEQMAKLDALHRERVKSRQDNFARSTRGGREANEEECLATSIPRSALLTG